MEDLEGVVKTLELHFQIHKNKYREEILLMNSVWRPENFSLQSSDQQLVSVTIKKSRHYWWENNALIKEENILFSTHLMHCSEVSVFY